ncbi:C-C motif chemokine 22 [Calypte anna]|uniref:C-C motif chemokine 22 n=1 Tax=Calypte anna TaxID=9244 RepID=UPI0011C45E69|nr:C-C motif chemokine 22 [Calypte anna]
MQPARTFLLLTLLLTSSLHPAPARTTPTECCYGYVEKPIQHPQDFYLTPPDCSLAAIVIVAATGAELCADPKRPWVKRAMKKLRRKK